MTDEQRGDAGRGLSVAPIEVAFGQRVQRGGGFVEDSYRRSACQGAGYGQSLPLSARRVHATRQHLAERRVDAARQPPEEVIETGALQDRFRCGAAGVRQISERDVIAYRERVAGEVLVHDAVEPVQGVLRPLVDGGAVDADVTRGWPIQSGQQLDDGRLARPVRSDESVVAAGAQREADAGEHRLLRIGVGKADAVELDALDRSPRLAPRERCAALFQPAEGGQIDQKLAVLGDTRGNLDDLHGYYVLRLQQRCHRRGVEGEVDHPAAERRQQRQHGGDDTADHDHAPGSEAEPLARAYLQVQPALPVVRRTPAIVHVLRISEQAPFAGRVSPLQDASRQILGAAPEDRQAALQPVHAPPSSHS